MKVIANPAAGFGRGQVSIRELQQRGPRLGIEILETEGPQEATRLARELVAKGESRLGVMGGDGTISEVVDAVVGSQTEVAILSVGTGNDIARSLGLPCNHLAASLKIAQNGQSRAVDVGEVSGRHFLSVLGVGFPAQVADESNRLKWLRGHRAFIAAIYKALWKMKPVAMEIKLDNQTLRQDCTSVLVLNTPFTGGGLRFAPNAKLDDGLFDVVVVGEIGKLNLMANFPRVYTGSHLNHPSFALFRAASVNICTQVPTAKMLDGDLCGVTPVKARILPQSLKVVIR